jgi:hypothetical protein
MIYWSSKKHPTRSNDAEYASRGEEDKSVDRQWKPHTDLNECRGLDRGPQLVQEQSSLVCKRGWV